MVLRVMVSVFAVICLLALPACALNTHLLPSQGEEMQAYFADFLQSYVVEGCLHSTAAGTSVAVPTCRAFAKDTAVAQKGQLRYLYEPTSRTLSYSAGNGPYFLAGRANVGVQPGGWTCAQGTHYCWIFTATQPAVPSSLVLLAKVIVAGGAITQVGDLRQDSPIPGQPLNVLSPLYGVVGDDVTDDTAALQAVLNASSWQARRVIDIPAAPRGACYAFTKLYFHQDDTDNPGWNADTNAQGRVILMGGGSLTLRDQIQNVPVGTCLRSTHAVGPAISIFSDVTGTVTNSQRTELRDLHVKGNNTTAIIRVNATTTNTWQNVSVEQENNTVGDGVQIWDSFIFQWRGGSVLGASTIPTGTGIGVHVSMPVNTVAGLVEFANMTSRNWGTCWQFGNDDASSNRLTNLRFSQVQAKGCTTHAMLLWAELRSVTIADSYFEEYRAGISVAGNNRAINVSNNYFAGTDVLTDRSSLSIGIPTAVTAPKTARQVAIRLNSFSSVPVDTNAIRIYSPNTAANGYEIAFNEFVGIGRSIKIVSGGGNLHQLYIYGNDYGTADPADHLVFEDITPGDPDGRVDFYGKDGVQTLGVLQQRLIGNRIDVLNTDTTLTFNSTANLQRFQVTVGTATVTTLAWTGGTPTTGTEFCLVRESASQNLVLAEGGNIQLDGGTSKTLTAEGSTICFVYFNAEYRQSRALVQHN